MIILVENLYTAGHATMKNNTEHVSCMLNN